MKYPELEDINNWTRREIYVHKTRIIIGLIFGVVLSFLLFCWLLLLKIITIN